MYMYVSKEIQTTKNSEQLVKDQTQYCKSVHTYAQLYICLL
jgi:hypothetical protein